MLRAFSAAPGASGEEGPLAFTSLGSAVVQGLFVAILTEISGNLWMTTLVE